MPIRYLAEIHVPEGRVRRDFSEHEIESLALSIKEIGLLHPPVVEEDGTLLAGERRFRALCLLADRNETIHCNGKWLQPGLIFTTNIRDLTQTQRLQAEIEENTIRVDITWQEKAEATTRLHELRGLQKIEGGNTTPQSFAETASEVRGKPLAEVSRKEAADVRADLLVQTWIEKHPEDEAVANAKNRSDALRLIETRLEDERRESLAKQFLAKRSGTGHSLEQGDMRLLLPQIPPGQFDCIITDPPWGVGAHSWDNQAAIRQHSYLDDIHTFETIHECLAIEGFRICKSKAHLYLFCSFQHFDQLARQFRSAGWDVWPQPLIWFKGTNAGIAPRPEHGPRQCYECILFANKGDKRVLQLRPDVLSVPKPSQDLRAAEKPALLYWELLSRSCLPGDEVLDPCCGAGPLLPAANALRLRATCYDLAGDAIGLASSRLAEVLDPSTSRMGVAA